MRRLLVATRNLHKVAEIRALLGGAFDLLSLRDVPGAPEVIEDADSFEGNALKKAETLAGWLSGTRTDTDGVLADDSGLEVDALGGAPGVHSARFAALDTGESGNSSDTDNNAKLLRLLVNVPLEQRAARFRCVIALAPLRMRSVLSTPQCFSGACEGRIGFEPRGVGGFGYDPLFLPEGFGQTFAELGAETKNRISHRSKALAKLKSALA